jgi:DNA-binding transcriptional LysR family regulator
MLSKDLSLFRLTVFCEVVKTGSFRIAAENLLVSQPAISQHIRALEDDIKLTLLQRGQILQLTEAGKTLFEYVRNVLAQTDEVSQLLRKLSRGDAGRVIFGANSIFARYVAPEVLSAFYKDNPGVEMVLIIGGPKRICELVLEREVDIGLIIGDTLLSGVDSQLIEKDEIVIVVGKGHALSGKAVVNVRELSEYPFFTITSTDLQRFNVVEGVLKANNIPIQHIPMKIGSEEAMIRILCSGVGIAAFLSHSIDDYLASGELIKLNLDIEPMYVNLRLVYKSDKHMTPAQNEFNRFLAASVSRIIKQNQFSTDQSDGAQAAGGQVSG